VTSPGFGLVDCVLIDLFLGNQVDTSRMCNGFMPSRVVDLSAIAPDQPWICTDETMRLLGDPDEVAAVRDAFRLAREVRQIARPHLTARDTSVDDVREAVEGDTALLATANALRRALSRFAIGVEGTELFRLAKELEEDQEVRRSRLPNDLEEA